MQGYIKCIIWDLDNTLWDGILLEAEEVALKPDIKHIIYELDKKGIILSIASKNNYSDAIKKLKEFGIDQYFLYPEINWSRKSKSIENIQKNLNIGIDTILFIDDQDFELDEVKYHLPEVEVINAIEYKSILSHSRLNPKVTVDSSRRRLMYFQDMQRKIEENNFDGPEVLFLQSLKMKFTISQAKENDLERAEELTIRTNQLNATGKTYSYEELDNFRKSDKHKLLVCELEDKYGSYGKIGIALIEINEKSWHLKLLLMSCRVISRGVGTILLSYIMRQTKESNKKLLADFRKTDRNKMMYLTYKLANFKEISCDNNACDNNGNIIFENDLSKIQELPQHVEVIIENSVN